MNHLNGCQSRAKGKKCPYKGSHVKHLVTSFSLPAQFLPTPRAYTHTHREPSPDLCVCT